MRFSARLTLFPVVVCMLAACSGGAVDAPQPATIEQDPPGVEVARTIVVTGGTQCALNVRKDRDDAEVFTAASCELKTGPGGAVTAVTLDFAPPCRRYTFNNLIGERYFLDEKALGQRNPACPIESFNAGYGWTLQRG
ncbi:MAG: hypothetical protein ACKOXG_00300 [Arenimonas sp.]